MDSISINKRKTINTLHHNHNQSTPSIKWTSPSHQQTFSTTLLHSLRHLNRLNSVKQAADNALAITAKGRTRWSRAILSNRAKLLLNNHKRAKINPKHPNSRLMREKKKKIKKNLPDIVKRVKVLGRLVPGCRKISFPNLLEETTDYIAALQMQVRAMAALADLLTAGSTNGSSRTGVV